VDLRAPIIQFWVGAARRHSALPRWLLSHQPLAHLRALCSTCVDGFIDRQILAQPAVGGQPL